MSRKPKKQTYPTGEEIDTKKDLFMEAIKNKKKSVDERKNPTQTFLLNIQGLLDHAINTEKLSYTKVSEVIEEIHGVKINPSAISDFAVKYLGAVKATRRKSKPKEEVQSVVEDESVTSEGETTSRKTHINEDGSVSMRLSPQEQTEERGGYFNRNRSINA